MKQKGLFFEKGNGGLGLTRLDTDVKRRDFDKGKLRIRRKRQTDFLYQLLLKRLDY